MSEDRQVPDRHKYALSGTTQVGNLDYGLAGLLCYIPVVSLFASLLFLFSEPKENKFLRFHAIQSLAILAAYTAGMIVFSLIGILTAIPIIGGFIGLVSGLVWFLFSAVYFIGAVVLGLKAREREMYKLPYVGDFAETQA